MLRDYYRDLVNPDSPFYFGIYITFLVTRQSAVSQNVKSELMCVLKMYFNRRYPQPPPHKFKMFFAVIKPSPSL